MIHQILTDISMFVNNKDMHLTLYTLQLHYNVVLYNADTLNNAVFAWLPNIFPVYCVWKYQQTIAVYTMQAVKILLPVYFQRNFTPVNLPQGGVNGSLNLRRLQNRGSCVIKDNWATFVYRIKLLRHVENLIMMINNAGDVFKLCIRTKENKSFTTCKDHSKRPCNRCARYISYQWYFKRFIEVFNASLWKILQHVYLTKRRSTSLTVQ